MSRKLLSLGSVIYLKEGKIPVMIVVRQPVLNLNNTFWYFDYGAVNHRVGLTRDEAVYFNDEDISQVVFKGFESEDEYRIQDALNEWKLRNTDIVKGTTQNI